jgi:hypothetical protein
MLLDIAGPYCRTAQQRCPSLTARRRGCDRVAMITSIHALIYSDDVDATRTFLRDVLDFPHVNDRGTDDGSATGWLIFGGTGPSELGVHATPHRGLRAHSVLTPTPWPTLR